MDWKYSCYSCEKKYSNDKMISRCENCGEPLWVEGDFKYDWKYSNLKCRDIRRYSSALPVKFSGNVPYVGGTPFRKSNISKNLYLKDETKNLTGSFKDRGSLIGILKSIDFDYDTVATLSHGNMAISMASLSSVMCINCLIFIPYKIPVERIYYIKIFDPKVIYVRGDYGKLYDISIRIGEDKRISFINSDNPFRIEGQKTTSFEIIENMDWRVPDHVILPLSSGGNASAVWKGFSELYKADLIEKIPTINCAQPKACSPIYNAFSEGKKRVTRIDKIESTIAYSIINNDPPSGNRILRKIYETGGRILAITDEEMLDSQKQLALRDGVFVEPSSASAIATYKKLKEEGFIDKNESTVIILTGAGFKEKPILKEMEISPIVGINKIEMYMKGLKI